MFCDKCGTGNMDVLSVAPANGEYGCVMLCRLCIDGLFAEMDALRVLATSRCSCS